MKPSSDSAALINAQSLAMPFALVENLDLAVSRSILVA